MWSYTDLEIEERLRRVEKYIELIFNESKNDKLNLQVNGFLFYEWLDEVRIRCEDEGITTFHWGYIYGYYNWFFFDNLTIDEAIAKLKDQMG